MLVLLAFCAVAGLMMGSVSIPADTAVSILIHWASGGLLLEPTWRDVYTTIVVETRIPRVILAGTVGATLGVAGMTIQAIVRNPLAGPSILGVSSGAATGAVIVMRWGLVGLGAFTLHFAAFLGALAAL